MVPIILLFVLIVVAVLRSPSLVTGPGLGSAVIVAAPLILATYALTVIVMAGRGGVDLSDRTAHRFHQRHHDSASCGWGRDVGGRRFPVRDCRRHRLSTDHGTDHLLRADQAHYRGAGRLSDTCRAQSRHTAATRRSRAAVDEFLGSGRVDLDTCAGDPCRRDCAWFLFTRTAFFNHLRIMAQTRELPTQRASTSSSCGWAHCHRGVYAGLAAICFTSLISSGDPTQAAPISDGRDGARSGRHEPAGGRGSVSDRCWGR